MTGMVEEVVGAPPVAEGAGPLEVDALGAALPMAEAAPELPPLAEMLAEPPSKSVGPPCASARPAVKKTPNSAKSATNETDHANEPNGFRAAGARRQASSGVMGGRSKGPKRGTERRSSGGRTKEPQVPQWLPKINRCADIRRSRDGGQLSLASWHSRRMASEDDADEHARRMSGGGLRKHTVKHRCASPRWAEEEVIVHRELALGVD